MDASKNGDELMRPVRVYADIPQSLDIALKVLCAKTGKSRKQYLAEIIRDELEAKGAIASRQSPRHN